MHKTCQEALEESSNEYFWLFEKVVLIDFMLIHFFDEFYHENRKIKIICFHFF